jgi:putative flippase GtrA
VRFLLVGGAAFVLDWAVVWALTHIGVGPYLARVISLSVSVTFTFWLNRFATFQANGQATLGEFAAYLAASGIGMVINYGIYALCIRLGLSLLAAMAIGTISAACFNFFAYGLIFKKSSQ